MTSFNNNLRHLDKNQLAVVMSFINESLRVSDADVFHDLLLEFSKFFGYEYVVYGYMRLPYSFNKHVTLINISAPLEWVQMYKERGFMLSDPSFAELDRRVKNNITEKYIPWEYSWELTREQKEVIKQRKAHGLKHGFCGLEYSYSKEAGLMISFSSSSTEVKPYMPAIMETVMPHINAARVKLDVLELIDSLSERELAVAELLVSGKKNEDIASDLGITVATVKFHMGNIFGKFQVTNRQEAVSFLLAARYLNN